MKELTSQDFGEATKGKAVIDFWAPWCGPCQMMGPQFEEASKEAKGVNFFKVNVDDEGELAGKYGVRSIPTLVFLKDGEVAQTEIGAKNKDQILEKVKEAFE